MKTRARLTLGAVGVAALLPVLLPHPFVLTIATQAAIWALLAASWDLLSGYTGQISFGHAGFFALGAYGAAVATKHADLSPWLGLLVGAGVAAAVGLLTGFPALRLRGHYLALVTLGLAEIIRLVAQNWLDVTGGPFGIHDFRSLPGLPAGARELGVVYASVEGVNEHSFDECLAELTHKAQALGATALIGMQLVQSQFQWNQRTSLLATAIQT